MMAAAVQHDPIRSPPSASSSTCLAHCSLDPYVADDRVAPDSPFIRFAGTPLPQSTWC